jgi:aspartate carbamoyltransferase catalytic subunit
MAKKRSSPAALRHVTSINDLSKDEVERLFREADGILETSADPHAPHRVARTGDGAKGFILGALFYEPSTRTRLSFETAMLRLGGATISSADPATSSAAKGESLADTVRVASNYADILVLRHPRDGAARLAAEYASVPVINGGDGAHEHPTQTLCDLYTLRRQQPRKFKDLNVAVSGDLKGSRTIHSFVYALARFGANIVLMPAKGMGLPDHVFERLRDEFNCEIASGRAAGGNVSAVDALYVTPNRPHQLSLIANTEIEVRDEADRIDVVYVTRFQKERWKEAKQEYPKIDRAFLKDKRYANTRILHPLPRVGELDTSLDEDERAVYFEQAAYGVVVRMALISLMLGVGEQSELARHDGGFGASKWPVYDRPPGTGLSCANPNCIVHDELERKHCRDKFHLVEGPKLRCVYCETDTHEFVAADTRSHRFHSTGKDTWESLTKALPSLIFYPTLDAAAAAGYSPRRRAV